MTGVPGDDGHTAEPGPGVIGGAVRPPGERRVRTPGPTVPRLLLGNRLRRLREGRGIGQHEAAAAIRASTAKIRRLELGRSGFKLRDLSDLLTLYGVADQAERATLLALGRQANVPGWWQPYADVIPSWFAPYLGLEQAAEVIRGYEVQLVPGLLQTPAYARALIALGHPQVLPAEIDRRLELRLRRQEILGPPQPVRLWVVIDEAALRRPIGGRAVMREQLRHLLEMNERTNVTVQVMPFDRGGQTVVGGGVSLLRLPGGLLPDVVYVEHLTSAVYPARPAEIERYQQMMDRLVVTAAPVGRTGEILHRILADI
jgi:transcriptional regulator with XRE-family HTH domain